jgi:hypothetical protein
VSLQEYSERRVQLARQITGQRRELAEAYRDLGKPLFYAQSGIKGVQMVRQNAWLIALAPSVIGIVSGLLGLRKKEATKRGLFDFWKKKAGTSEEEIESQALRRARPLLRRLIGHGVTAFKLYRRIRPFIPL